MAEDNDENAENEQETKGKTRVPLSGKKKLILIIVIGLLVLTLTIVGTLWLLGVFDSDDEPEAEMSADGEVAEQMTKVEKPSPAMYFPIKPAFVVNFPDKGRQRYLQVEMTIQTRDPDVFTGLQTHLPLIKNRLIMLMGGEVYDELQTDEGKELLRQKCLEALQEVMQQELGKPGIEQVLFTSFVMQ